MAKYMEKNLHIMKLLDLLYIKVPLHSFQSTTPNNNSTFCAILFMWDFTFHCLLAILSVSNKQGLVEFAKKLDDLGFKLIASGGTANKIGTAEIPVRYLFFISNQ